MTIVYLKEKFPPPPFDEEVQQIHYFRDLYDGNHENIFSRAQELAKETQVTRYIRKPRKAYLRKQVEKTALHHYVIVNFSSVIAELPADLINRSLGNISADTETDKQLLDFVQQVSKTSKINQKIWAAVVQHQVDGGVAYRIRRDAKGTWFEWKPADMYYEHDDDLGADIPWVEERGDEKFLRVERQRLEENKLIIKQLVFRMDGETVQEEKDILEYVQQFGIEVPADQELEGITELMCGYIPNDETLLTPRGRSAIAILYEWIQSVIKAEAIQEKFDEAIKEAIRKCIILEKVSPPLSDDISNTKLVFREYSDPFREKPTGLEIVMNIE